MPGGNGRPQKGMNRRNHHDPLGQSGMPRYGGGNFTSKPKYTPPKQQGSFLEDLLLGRQSNKPKRKRK